MKLIQVAPVAVALLFTAFLATPAKADLTVTLTDNAGSQTFDLGHCQSGTVGKKQHKQYFQGTTCTANEDSIYLNDNYFATRHALNGQYWDTLNVAVSNSPNGEQGITITGNEHALSKYSFLRITISDNGFTIPYGPSTIYNQGGALGSNGLVRGGQLNATGYMDGLDKICTSMTCGGVAIPVLTYQGYKLNSQMTQDAVDPASAYSLDEVITATFGSPGDAVFGFTINVMPNTAAPEPASILLLGAIAASALVVIRRRRRAHA